VLFKAFNDARGNDDERERISAKNTPVALYANTPAIILNNAPADTDSKFLIRLPGCTAQFMRQSRYINIGSNSP
jgi:hypothetical protein